MHSEERPSGQGKTPSSLETGQTRKCCVHYLSGCYDKIHNQSPVGKEAFFFVSRSMGTIHCSREVMVTGKSGRWSHHIHSREAESRGLLLSSIVGYPLDKATQARV